MIIGLDFDNTIVNYERVFYDIALEEKLIPAGVGRTKQEVKSFLQESDRGEEWTRLQGIVYGPGILRAEPYPGVREFLEWCRKNHIKTCVISHKTKYPFIGEKHDLHAWAKRWLQEKGFFVETTGISLDNTFFGLTIEEKIVHIVEQKCTHFLDDLPEILNHPAFPRHLKATLFSPDKLLSINTEVTDKVSSWKQYQQTIETEQKAALLVSEPLLKIKRQKGGRNNQAFGIITASGKKVFLKSYFRSPTDTRDRLRTEFTFLSFLWQKGLRQIPMPLHQDPAEALGLYSFIEGSKIQEVTSDHVKQTIRFYQEINKHKDDATHLAPASEACFTINDHLALLEKRLEKARRIKDQDVQRFLLEKVIPKWQEVRQGVIKTAGSFDCSLPLPPGERCLSPSDFGFHNALILPDGKITFLDFEYAGWDDPAKMVCDFFCQPEVPVPLAYFPLVAKEVFSSDENGMQRAASLLPVHQLKWCCIMLNEFLPEEAERRAFAQTEAPERRQQEQLSKAQSYFARALEKV